MKHRLIKQKMFLQLSILYGTSIKNDVSLIDERMRAFMKRHNKGMEMNKSL